MSPLASRAAGIITSPQRTMTALAAAPAPPWADALLASTLAIFLALASLLATGVGRTALVDQMERRLIAFGYEVDPGLYARLRELSGHGLAFAAGFAVLQGPVAVLGSAAVLAVTLRATGQAASPSVLASIAAHAGVILALRQVVAAPLNYLGESLASPLSLDLLLSGTDEGATLARLLGSLDLFVIWWGIVLAVGVSATTRWRTSRLAVTFLVAYVAVAALLALAMAAAGGPA